MKGLLLQRTIGVGVTFLTGTVAAFFLAGPIVFADGSMGEKVATLGEEWLIIGLTIGAFLISAAAGAGVGSRLRNKR